MGPWDPDSTQKGIAGSKESIIYLSEKLADIGYEVTIIGNPPPNSPYSSAESNPRYVPFDFVPETKFDYAIAWRMWWVAEALKYIADKIYYWPHDIYLRNIQKEEIDTFEEVFWLSNWQRDRCISINPAFEKFATIYGNGINLEDLEPIAERKNPYACIYASNYARGLKTLLNCWPQMKARFPKATLDIYYGWASWSGFTPEEESALREQIDRLSSLGVTEHGLVGHKELNKAYSQASLWTYPCNGNETFCISALKAQGSGAIPVVINCSALKETVRHGYLCSSPEEYPATLMRAMEEIDKISLNERKKMRNFIAEAYTWKKIAEKWHTAFESIPKHIE